MTRERVLITGGASGIGATIVERAIQAGLEPVVIDRIGDGIIADLSDAEATRNALDEALRDGPIHRLVNNVGAIKVANIEDVTLEQLQFSIDLNLRAALLCTQAVVTGMKERGFGRIVNMASRTIEGKEGRTTYGAAKAGLVGMTRTWALELGRHGITVNAIAPGPIRTQMFEAANPPGAPSTQAIIDSIPVQRMGEPEDVAHATNFFLADESGFITGQTLYVCGGKTVGTAAF